MNRYNLDYFAWDWIHWLLVLLPHLSFILSFSENRSRPSVKGNKQQSQHNNWAIYFIDLISYRLRNHIHAYILKDILTILEAVGSLCVDYFHGICCYFEIIKSQRSKLNLFFNLSEMYLDIFKHMRVTDNARCQKKSI